MNLINTTFAHGNGPYSRCVEWAIEVNNVREERGLGRLGIIVPLIYPDRQREILKIEIASNVAQDFLDKHPDEILFDEVQGILLSQLMFSGSNYSENLTKLHQKYYDIESKIQKHLSGTGKLKTFTGKSVKVDFKQIILQLGLNNRVQTNLPSQFYSTAGAGPFDEILEKSNEENEIKIDRMLIEKVLPIAKRMMENQEIIFSNYPGVFSYDNARKLRQNEMLTPPFIHPRKKDNTKIAKGVYLIVTGIDGIRQSNFYNAVKGLGMKIYTQPHSIKDLPKEIEVMPLELDKINNPNILVIYARSGWSSVWTAHLTGKGFMTPKFLAEDDPEIFFNEKSILKLHIGAVVNHDVIAALDEALKLSKKTFGFNRMILEKYGTLDGIRFAAEKVVDALAKKGI